MVVSEPNIAQDILTSPGCVNKSLVYKALDDGTGKGLFSLKGISAKLKNENKDNNLVLQIPIGVFIENT